MNKRKNGFAMVKPKDNRVFPRKLPFFYFLQQRRSARDMTVKVINNSLNTVIDLLSVMRIWFHMKMTN